MNCYILAGGRSQRMGKPKVELFFDRVSAAVRPVFDEVLAVQRAEGHPLPLRTLFENPHEDEGPMFGLQRALRDASGKAFVIAVDYPLITVEVIRHLAARFESSGAEALVPVWGGRLQPLCGGYDSSLLPVVERRLARRAYEMHGLLNEVQAEIVEEKELRERFEGEPLLNVNTPEELEKAEAMYGR